MSGAIGFVLNIQGRTEHLSVENTVKGHYRTDCWRNQETEEEKDDLPSPYMTGIEPEPGTQQEDPISEDSDAELDASKIVSTNKAV